VKEYQSYEQPLNERIRAFLRLEKLFQQFSFHVKHGSIWNSPIAIDSINELQTFTARSDIKLEALKELERQHIRLERLAKRPQIDQSQLLSVLQKQKNLIGKLQDITGSSDKESQKAELLTAIKQKSSVPGCICDFDLPAFQFWLSRPEQVRTLHLETWFKQFNTMDKAVHLILDILRHSVDDTDEHAPNGFFQKSLDTNQKIQLLSIGVPKGSNYYPEISAGKHRFSIRFMINDDPSKRPEQSNEDIDFKLRMCTI
jgi:cell division protein ZapD